MPRTNWSQVTKEIMIKAKSGFKLSEVTGIRASVTKQLVDKGRLIATPTARGDFIINLP